MSNSSKKIINSTKLIMALVLMCLMFGLTAMAQTDSDKPLDAKTLAALVEELKGVVSKMAPQANEAAMVSKKWNARKDLMGKTKKDVINLLYEDVKSVIKDSGTQYQIYSTISFYKQMPDEQFSDESKAKQTNSSKQESVEKLVDLVFMSHPYVNVEEQIAGLPGPKDVKAAEAEDRKNRIAGFDAALKINKKLTAAQKAFVRANYDKLIKSADKITEDAINLNFPTKQWIQEGLENIFAKRFTVEEINNLTAFFDSDKGAQVLNYVRQTNMAEIIIGNGGKLDFTAADKAEHDKFAATPLGKKFMTAYLQETNDYEKSKVNAAMSKIPNADGFEIYRPENLNKLFNKFVADNYRK